MRTAIVVAPRFDASWPYAADRLHDLLASIADVSFQRLAPGDDRPLARIVDDPAVERVFSLGVPLTESDLDALPKLAAAFVTATGYLDTTAQALVESRGVEWLAHRSEGFWGQSVAEFALALTLAALRRIPQTHHAMLTSLSGWEYPFEQFGDDPDFTNGTLAGKRVRVVGAGNIASRYAGFAGMLGAEVAAWDPFAPEPSFHRAGARREWHLDHLVRDAEIFAPLVPLTPGTKGIVTAEHIDALPKGALVVLATRAGVCDMDALRRRVLADELSLAADVFDVEPLPLDDPLLGRRNVVHTPHNAGRTKEANFAWAEMLVEQLRDHDPATTPARRAVAGLSASVRAGRAASTP